MLTNRKVVIEGNEIDYVFIKKLCQGTFGRAELFESTRRTVLKSVPFENKRMMKLAENEAKLIATLSHPNVVRIFNAWIDETRQEIVMELKFCGGKDLHDAISNAVNTGTRFGMSTLKAWTAQLALGLGYIHEMGIVHRGIKPENVVLSTDSKTLKIIDFGTAKMMTTSTLTIGPVGTPVYMAPEAFDRTNKAISDEEPKNDDERLALFQAQCKLDVWAFGIVVFEMALLEVPYKPRTIQTTFLDMMLVFQTKIEPLRIDDLEKCYSRSLRQLVEQKLLVYDPKERSNMAQVLQDGFLSDEAKRFRDDYHKDCAQEQISLLRRQAHSLATRNEALEARNKALERELKLKRLQPNVVETQPAVIDEQKELFEPCCKGNNVLVRFLLLNHHQANVDAKYEEKKYGWINGQTWYNGCTCLIFAAFYGKVGTVKILIQEFNAKVDEQDEVGVTALLSAAWKGRLAVVRFLCVDGNADLEKKTMGGLLGPGSTALMRAVKNGSYEVIEYLLKRGAKVNEKTNKGKTALALAKTDYVRRLLKKYGATL